MKTIILTGEVRFTCPVCGWSVTLTAEGAKQWTHNGTIHPRCGKDDVALVQSRLYLKPTT